MRAVRVLYLSYTGLLEPLGESQVLSYLITLGREHEICLITFEKNEDLNNREKVAQLCARCRAAGIRWLRLRYHRRPRVPATFWDLVAFFVVSFRISRKRHVQLIHARSYIPCFVALSLKWTLRIPFIFDMRGFWPEEMITARRLRAGSLIYRLLKRLENRCLVTADAVVVLTHAAVEYLRADDRYGGVQFEVIPTCADLGRFSPLSRRTSRAADRLVVGVIGTVTGWFRLDWTIAFYRALRAVRRDAVIRIVTREDPEVVRREATRQGVGLRSVEIYSRKFEEMPDEVRQLDVGVFMYASATSEIARCPTRMAELLGSGVPCVVNDSVGDVATIVQQYGVGVVVRDGTDSAMAEAAELFLALVCEPDLPQRCRRAAEEWFSLDVGVKKYDTLYRALALDTQK